MKIYITKFACTKGIVTIDVPLKGKEVDTFRTRGVIYNGKYIPSKCWYVLRSMAIKNARNRVQKEMNHISRKFYTLSKKYNSYD